MNDQIADLSEKLNALQVNYNVLRLQLKDIPKKRKEDDPNYQPYSNYQKTIEEEAAAFSKKMAYQQQDKSKTIQNVNNLPHLLGAGRESYDGKEPVSRSSKRDVPSWARRQRQQEHHDAVTVSQRNSSNGSADIEGTVNVVIEKQLPTLKPKLEKDKYRVKEAPTTTNGRPDITLDSIVPTSEYANATIDHSEGLNDYQKELKKVAATYSAEPHQPKTTKARDQYRQLASQGQPIHTTAFKGQKTVQSYVKDQETPPERSPRQYDPN